MPKLGFLKSSKTTSDTPAPQSILQRKMTSNVASDPLEHQAEFMATSIHRKINSHTSVQQLHDVPSTQADAPESVNKTLHQGGQPLEAGVRKDMERHIGHDFSRVRVHNDSAASKSANEVRAHAYTAGQHVVFGNNEYQPLLLVAATYWPMN